jgi:hypothetical protein
MPLRGKETARFRALRRTLPQMPAHPQSAPAFIFKGATLAPDRKRGNR